MRAFQASWLQLIFIALLLSGCVHQAPKAPLISQDWAKHKTQVDAINNWQATGKLAIKMPNGGVSPSIKWVQTGRTYHIDLSGPFGSGKLTIDGEPNSVTLTEAGQNPQTAKTAEELIRKNSGWNIPVTQLAF
ncbi:MAG TPA: lipoprotein insertase outer membrane protein LolB, partial [Cellvibrio sp.]|nr:lipoprotein insertase outer membrane protein LolB [Cellvibrio sp.]